MTSPAPAPADAPRVAIVVPVYRHPMLVAEALHSALTQTAPFGIKVIAVNDGCPDPETHRTLSTFAAAHPDRMVYLRKPNGGLSSARNFGIQYALETLPSVEAIYMLDADNRLRPTAMAHAMAALDRHPEAGWIYPSIDMFGIKARCDYGGPYSRLIHSEMNVCEAGSLIRRAVFEAGVVFDETFLDGFEDWHFFLSAGDAGFRGVNIEDFGFFYRKRPESMLAEAGRVGQALTARIRAAHPELYNPKTRIALEHEEAPRYAIFRPETGEVQLVTDPGLPGECVAFEDYIERYWLSRSAPGRHRVPPFLVVATEALLSSLRARKLEHWFLWRLEHAAKETEIAAVTLGPARRERGLTIEHVPAPFLPDRQQAVAWIMSASRVYSLVSAEECSDLATDDSLPVTGMKLRLDMSEEIAPACASAQAGLDALHSSTYSAAGQRTWSWRQNSIRWRGSEHILLRKDFENQPVFPKVPGQSRDIGIVASELPMSEVTGYVTKLRSTLSAGARLHLFLMTTSATDLSPAVTETFDSVALLGEGRFNGADAQNRAFDGAILRAPSPPHLASVSLAMLYWVDEIHNLGSLAASPLMGPLRRFGTQTYLHIAENTPQPISDEIALALAYEHAYDGIYVNSESVDQYLRGLGLPAEKLIPSCDHATFTQQPACNLE